MKSFFSVFSSTRTTAVLLFIFATSIAAATFIEKNAGTETARRIVYDAKWFEFLFLFGAANIIAVTMRFKLYRREKRTVFVFHLAFLIIILGAAITRYFGKEGMMHIREGQTTDQWYSSLKSIRLKVSQNGQAAYHEFPLHTVRKGGAGHSFQFGGHEMKVRITGYYPHAEKVLLPDPEGSAYVDLITADNSGQRNYMMTYGDTLELQNSRMIFDDRQNLKKTEDVRIFEDTTGMLGFVAPYPVTLSEMGKPEKDILDAGEMHTFTPMKLYNFNGVPVIIRQYISKGIIAARAPADHSDQLPSAVEIRITCDSFSRPVTLWESDGMAVKIEKIMLAGTGIALIYGRQMQKLPFSLTLNDFILKRYPGSESPSWFESNVQLTDPLKNTGMQYRIYMNHILKYRGYRFYQTSYDDDEQGTILSLNHDGLGTAVTYAGYIMLTLGIIMSLLNRKSHFRSLISKPLSNQKAAMLVLAGLFFSFSSIRAVSGNDRTGLMPPVIDKSKARDFGMLLVQNNSGRIMPLNTLSSEVLRKVARKEIFTGQTPDQVMLGMMVYPEEWQQVPVIKVSNPRIRKILGMHTGYASFADFFTAEGTTTYVLKPYVDEAYRKEPVSRNKFDNEVIRTDERLNICYLIFTQEVLLVFPDPYLPAHKWYSPVTVSDVCHTEDSVFTNHIMNYYFEEVSRSMKTGNWESTDKLLEAVKTFQKKKDASVIPTGFHIKAELLYNRSNLLGRLIHIYLYVGLILLIIQLVYLFLPRISIRYFSMAAILVVSLAFVLHTAGLALRWYVSGHAPLSNGFEALSFVAWATVLAGLIFSRKSSLTVSTTAVLSALILMVAHLSWMDPQITNLVPVLKSYWLVIHVTVVTASYGFLGMGALLAVMNMLLMIIESQKNFNRVDNQIELLTQIIELTLIAGLYLLTTGAFLGGVWANESWGRYWGWDPKETWALITVIVYAFILHMRIVPAMKGRLLFNIMALAGFSSVLMTYFGVNYYLTGLHSYASGEPMPLPPVVYYALIAVMVLIVLVIAKQSFLKKRISTVDTKD
jgi:cytochrome c-type biogenesis protein CcsB